MSKGKKLLGFKEVIQEESRQLKKRREKLFKDGSEEEFEETKFGIALSGGGIRSATINLGFLKTLNKFGILKRADYISTVSGGGYTGSYIQACLKSGKSYDSLFQDTHIDYMRSRGEYLMPGTSWKKRWNILVLTVGYLVSLLMSWISPLIVIVLSVILYAVVGKILNLNQISTLRNYLLDEGIAQISLYVFLTVFIIHFVFNIFMKYNVGVSRKFNHLESILVGIGVFWLTAIFVAGWKEIKIEESSDYIGYIFLALMMIIIGLFTNPNALSFHRFYRNQLADAFLHFTNDYRNIKIKDLFNIDSEAQKDYMAPYPLINTCLNLQAVADKKFQGTKANDYFLLSPLYCGAKLTKFVATKEVSDYREMTLPAATTISAAAVNPGMGMYSNKLLSIIMTLANARLGFWITNPLKISTNTIVWWPVYFFYELFSRIGTNNKMLNISDGGHIENLGVYELLRRKCQLIIAVDAGADPTFGFSDLENLTIRARNELGLAIRFRADHIPEEKIRPKPSHGYSAQRFAIADIFQLWEEVDILDDDACAIVDQQGKEIQVLINFDDINAVVAEKLKNISEENEIIANDIKEIIGNRLKVNAKKKALKNAQNSIDKIKVCSPEDKALIEKRVKKVIEDRLENNLKVGSLIYVKSSVTAPEGKPLIADRSSLEYGTYKYKIYHPSFPHEPTSDQFFDPIQWEAYYQLGQFIGADVLGDDDLTAFYCANEDACEITARKLIDYVDNKEPSLCLTKDGMPSLETTPVVFEKEFIEPKAAIEEELILEEVEGEMEEAMFGEEVSEEEVVPKEEDRFKVEKMKPTGTVSSPTPAQQPVSKEKKVLVGKEIKYKM